VLGPFYAALDTSVLTSMTTQISARITPPSNLMLSGGDGSNIQFCSWLYVSKLLFVTLRLTRARYRVGSDLELCHHRPPGCESNKTVSAE
jgi:hypothetical protein